MRSISRQSLRRMFTKKWIIILASSSKFYQHKTSATPKRYMNIIETFNTIRDVPYRIPLTSNEVDNCCSGKARMLKVYFDKEGYESRYRVCEFRWPALGLPQSILSVPHDDLSSHVYLEVKINDKWIDVDPTWDMAINSIFKSNQWDGKSNTTVAVPVISKYDDEKSDSIMSNETPEIIEKNLTVNGLFYRVFNDWLDQIRN